LPDSGEHAVRAAFLAVAALNITFNAQPALAQQGGYPVYPWCSLGGSGESNCYFSTLEQCRASSRNCYQNPFYPACGSRYSFGAGAHSVR
jgi:hypothetical protein